MQRLERSGRAASAICCQPRTWRWANRLPGVVGTLFDRPITIAAHWQAWDASQRAITPNYVLPDGWAPRLQVIQQHLQFSSAPFDPVLPVQCAAGVGKTRLVFEAIRQMPGAQGLVFSH